MIKAAIQLYTYFKSNNILLLIFSLHSFHSFVTSLGAIRGAIVVDVNGGTVLSELGLSMQGTNGLLSNLDLINLFTKARSHKRNHHCKIIHTTRLLPPTTSSKTSSNILPNPRPEQRFGSVVEMVLKSDDDVADVSWYEKMLKKMLTSEWKRQGRWIDMIVGTVNCMLDIALGPVPGGHSHFLDHGIDAVTLNTRNSLSSTRDGSSSSAVGEQLLEVDCVGAHLEVVVRSISSMSETFHQSFWQYLLPRLNFMVTVEEYGLLYVLFTAPVAFSMLRLNTYHHNLDLNVKHLMYTLVPPSICGLTLYLIAHYFFTRESGSSSNTASVGSIRERTVLVLCLFFLVWSITIMSMILLHNSKKTKETMTIKKKKKKKKIEFEISDLLLTKEQKEKTQETQETSCEEWKGTMLVIEMIYYIFHVWILGIMNYSFAMMTNLLLIPLLCSMRPLFLQPKNKENEENGTSEDLSLLSFYGLTMYRLLHSLLLLLSSPPFIVVYVIPALWRQSHSSGSFFLDGNGNGVDGILECWCGVLRSFSELRTFHVGYFCLLYVPFHTMICRITWSRG